MPLQDANPTPSFGGFGLRPSACNPEIKKATLIIGAALRSYGDTTSLRWHYPDQVLRGRQRFGYPLSLASQAPPGLISDFAQVYPDAARMSTPLDCPSGSFDCRVRHK